MATIQGIYAREILDSRGVPTIECTLWLDTGGIVATSVPTGTSVGKYEALELRDKDANRMLGKGVQQAVTNVNTTIAQNIIGKDPTQQEEIDTILIQLDGTPNKSKLGANAILAASQAVLKAGALTQNLPLYYYILQKYQVASYLHIPNCIFTVVNGGEHGADNLDIQEFQIIPASHIEFDDALNMGVTLFHKLEEVLVIKGAIHSVGLVGGFTPNLYSNTDVFEILVETIKTSPYTFAQDLFFGMDVAASEIFQNGKYQLKDRSQAYSSKELLEYYKKLRGLYHVFCIEDPFQEDDLESWQRLTLEMGETTRIIGDSLLATNKEKTAQAIEKNLCNTLLVKPNQIGTISETIEVIRLARTAGWQIVMSHRSGETNDDLIADFAVGVGADYVKFGPPNRGERTAKYNRLLQIHQEIQLSKQQNPSEHSQPPQAPVATEQPQQTTAQSQPSQETHTPTKITTLEASIPSVQVQNTTPSPEKTSVKPIPAASTTEVTPITQPPATPTPTSTTTPATLPATPQPIQTTPEPNTAASDQLAAEEIAAITLPDEPLTPALQTTSGTSTDTLPQ